MAYEICCECAEPTGRAGRGEDSLYADDFGPYCEDCYGDVPEKFGVRIVGLEGMLAKTETEREQLRKDKAELVAALIVSTELVRHQSNGLVGDPDHDIALAARAEIQRRENGALIKKHGEG